MPQSSYEPLDIEGRQRLEDQLLRMQERLTTAGMAWDSDHPADYNYLYVPDKFLVDEVVEGRFQQVFSDRSEDLPFPEPLDPVVDRDVIPGLRAWKLPEGRTDPKPQDVLAVMNIMDDELEGEEGGVSLEHVIHVAADGSGRLCPATEPEETGLSGPWPEALQGNAGAGVDVVVVDAGWRQSVGPNEPLPELDEYDGHGPFALQVAKGRAPGASFDRVEFATPGGAVAEGVLVEALTAAIPDLPEGWEPPEDEEHPEGDPPHKPLVINLSAGCHTRRDRPLKAFERLWRNRLQKDPYTVLVAAAGNDASSLPFYPAASPWAWGVGSLDHNNAVSSFSNFRTSADVFVLGRNHINRFPRGTYTCREAPNTLDERVFTNGWARWSGTSFASPLVAGLFAAHVAGYPGTPRRAARDLIRSMRTWKSNAVYGDHRIIELERIPGAVPPP